VERWMLTLKWQAKSGLEMHVDNVNLISERFAMLFSLSLHFQQ
jgi:hypothetical protein